MKSLQVKRTGQLPKYVPNFLLFLGLAENTVLQRKTEIGKVDYRLSTKCVLKSWSGKIHYYSEVDKSPKGIIGDSQTILKEQSLIEDSREGIVRIYSYIVPLGNFTGTCLLLYHRFIVFKTDSWWWSIEKNNIEIVIQRSESEEAVKDKFLKVPRSGGAKLTLEKDSSSKVNVKSLLELLDLENVSFEGYHLLKSNCKVFGKRVFEYIGEKIERNAGFRKCVIRGVPSIEKQL